MNTKDLCRKQHTKQMCDKYPGHEHGFFFETHVINKIDAAGFEAYDTIWTLASRTGDEYAMKQNLSNLDDCNGDITLRRHGRVVAHLTLKSVCGEGDTDGVTITITDRHIKEFSKLPGDNWLCYARVRKDGNPIGAVTFVRWADFLPVWEKNKQQKKGDPYIWMKALTSINSDIIGIDEFLLEYK